MVAILVAGLIVGFVLGWGVYWYLQQSDSSAWTVPQFVREQPLVHELSDRLARTRPAAGAELLERTRTMLEHDTEAARVKELDEEPVDVTPVLTTPVTVEEDEPAEADAESVEEEEASATSDEDSPAPAEGSVLAYCLTCQMRRQIQDARRTETRTGRVAVRGSCPECGSELFTFVRSDN